MTDYQNYINALRKCAKEHENDTTYTGHIIVSNLCRDTANLLEALKQEPVLDKIRAEIEGLYSYVEFDEDIKTSFNMVRLEEVQRVIDKYKAETEDT